MQDLHVLFHGIHQLARELTKELNEGLEPFSLYSSQWTVIYVLKQKGSLTQKEISDYLSIEKPPMTRTIQKLVANGYVIQIPGADKRTKKIELTEKALEMYPVWEEAVLKVNQRLVEKFPDSSQKQLTNLIAEWTGQITARGRHNE
jgi:MarR family transcriptional regulator, transcriptional regulator for hemolysin